MKILYAGVCSSSSTAGPFARERTECECETAREIARGWTREEQSERREQRVVTEGRGWQTGGWQLNLAVSYSWWWVAAGVPGDVRVLQLLHHSRERRVIQRERESDSERERERERREEKKSDRGWWVAARQPGRP